MKKISFHPKLLDTLPGYGKGLDPAQLAGRVGFRPMSPDRLPMVGPLSASDGLWLINGFGARGQTQHRHTQARRRSALHDAAATKCRRHRRLAAGDIDMPHGLMLAPQVPEARRTDLPNRPRKVQAPRPELAPPD